MGSLVLGCACLPWTVRAQVPPNDLCAGAEVVAPDGVLPWSSSIVPDISEATTTGDPGTQDCYLGNVTRSLWYVFTPTESGLYRFSFSADTASTVADTVMALYTSANGCSGPFMEIACNDDLSAYDLDHVQKAALLHSLQAGTTYYVLVWLVEEFFPDEGRAIQLRVSRPEVPVNDLCQNAIVIPGNATFPYLTSTVDTLLATEGQDPPWPSCRTFPFPRRSVWYAFTPNTTAEYTITTCDSTETLVSDTLIGIYTSANSCAGPFTEIACDDSGCGIRAEVTREFEAGTTYYVVVWDMSFDAYLAETDVQLRISLPPTAVTLPASSITSTGAVLNAYLSPNSTRRTFYFFEWGTDTNYTMPRTDLEFLFMGSLEGFSYSFPLTGLSAGAGPYHYRIVMTNTVGSMIYGQDQVFSWDPAPPSLVNEVIPAPEDGAFGFEFTAKLDQLYFIEASTNLTHWELLGPALIQEDGAFSFTDTNRPPLPKRFYRVKAP